MGLAWYACADAGVKDMFIERMKAGAGWIYFYPLGASVRDFLKILSGKIFMHHLMGRHIVKAEFFLLFSAISLVFIEAMASEEVMHMSFELDESSVPMANVEIDGKHQTFMIDTGSSIALHLSKDFMAQLPGLVIDPEKERTTDLAGKVFLNDRFHIPQVSINGMTFRDVRGVSLTPWGMAFMRDGHLPTSMVIGLELFMGKAVLIDYKGRRLSVADHAQALDANVADDWIALPLRLTQEGIVVKVSQGLQDYNMVLDTGASISVFWKDRLKSPFVGISCRSVLAEMDNDGCLASAFRLKEIETEDVKLDAVLVDGAFDQLEMDGLIGKNFFEKYAVLIDFPAQRLLIKDNVSAR